MYTCVCVACVSLCLITSANVCNMAACVYVCACMYVCVCACVIYSHGANVIKYYVPNA